MAADVHRHFVRERGAGVGHAEHVVQELGQLEHPPADADDPRVGVGMAEEHAAHRRTRARGADDPAVRLEHVAEMADHPPRFFPIARVERRLAAAGLFGGVDGGHAVAVQQFDRGLGDPRIELVDVAGDEQRHRLARPIRRIVLPRRYTLGGSNHGSRPARFSVTASGRKTDGPRRTVMLFEAGQNPDFTAGASRWLEARRMPGQCG